MRIAQVTSLQESVPPRYKNGLEFIVSYLTEELISRGYQMTLFAPADSQTQAELVSVYPMGTTNDPNRLYTDDAYSYFNCLAAIKRAQTGKFDLIHSHAGPPMVFLSDLVNIPIIETYHHPPDFAYQVFYQEPYFSHLRQFFDLNIKIFKVFVSENQRAGFAKFFPKGYLTDKNSAVVYNGIPVENFPPSTTAGEYFAFLGYMTPNKGAHLAIKVAQRAGVPLVIAGVVGSDDAYFREQIEPHLNGDGIRFIGTLDHQGKVKFLQQAKAVFIPIQWEEPFGLVMVEAMACGTPVIGLKRAAVPEIVQDGFTGFVVNPGEDGGVAGMVEAVARIGEIDRSACRRRVEERFSVRAMVDGYEAIYRRLSSQGPSLR